MNQTDPWQVVPRQVFTPYDCLLNLVAFVVPCHIGCLWVTHVIMPCADVTVLPVLLIFQPNV